MSSVLMRQFATAVLTWLQSRSTMPLNVATHSVEVVSTTSRSVVGIGDEGRLLSQMLPLT